MEKGGESCWLAEVSTVLSYTYLHVKEVQETEWYIKHPDAYTARLMFKLRSGSCALAVSTQRYLGIPHEERTCLLCEGGVEDALHFCSQCSSLEDIRHEWKEKMLDLIEAAGMHSFEKLMLRRCFEGIAELDMMKILLGNLDMTAITKTLGKGIWMKVDVEEF